ncbi:MAG TPA: hypothetical protein DDZ67_04175 [Xanthomonadaceae bacterium]|nr:hypothetical protein [Xanthomonadaceae bacterium]
MHWLFLLLAIGALALAFTTPNMGVLVASLLAALALLLAWIRGWYVQRMGDVQRDTSSMIDPAELRRLRELAEARKAAAANPGEPQP